MLWNCKAGDREGILRLNRFSIPCDSAHGIAAVRFLDVHGNAAEHRQRAAVKGNKAPRIARNKVPNRFNQLRPAHGAAVCAKTVGHKHVGCHFFGISCLQHIARKAVSRCNQHIRPVNAAQRVCHDGISGIASLGVKPVGVGFLRIQHHLLVGGFRRKKLGVERLICLACIVLPRNHLRNHVPGNGEEII